MSFIYQHVEVTRVIDGDTVALAVDLGNFVKWSANFRLLGIDTPERGQPGYVEATEYLRTLLGRGVSRIETHKPDKYGRWLVDLYIAPAEGGELHVNRLMVLEGFARPYP